MLKFRIRIFSKKWIAAGLIVVIVTGFVLGTSLVNSKKGGSLSTVRRIITGQAFPSIFVRSGLPYLSAKLKAHSAVKIVFLGGSITQNADRGGFITALQEWLQKKYPTSVIEMINAGMASTDSAWGAKRIDSDVLVHKPDVVFVEFAVNDGNRESSQDMERIVRKIHAANPESEIVFIYTTSDSAFRKLMSGQIPFAIAQHEKVAEHYQIPALVFGADLASRIESGEWKWLDFSNDACHPTIAGYESYSRDLLLSFDRFLQAANRIQSRFPEPLCDNFQLRPSKIELSCIANSEALSDGNGNLAIQTERMPVFGLQWIDEPFYQTPSGSSWRLEYAVFSGMPNHADGSLLKANWLPARWFEEGRGFTGERSRILARGNLTSNELCVPPYLLPRSVEVPQVRWEAGQGGECLIDISIAKIEGHVNGAPALAGVDLLIHRQGEKMEALASITGENAKPLHLRHPVRLLEGDAIVIRPFAKGYEYLNLKNFDFVVGFFENPPIP